MNIKITSSHIVHTEGGFCIYKLVDDAGQERGYILMSPEETLLAGAPTFNEIKSPLDDIFMRPTNPV